MVTEYIPVNYGSAEDIAKLLTEESKSSMGSGGGGGGSSGAGQRSRGFLSSRGSISFDRRTNTLLVIDIPDRVANIKNLVMQLDRPVDQVVRSEEHTSELQSLMRTPYPVFCLK